MKLNLLQISCVSSNVQFAFQLMASRAKASIGLSSLQFTVPGTRNVLRSDSEVDIFMSTVPCFY